MTQDLSAQIENYLGLFLQRKRLVILIALISMSVGVVTSYFLPKKYEASATVFIEQSVISDLVKGIAITPSVDSKIKVLSVAMLSRNILSKVIKNLDRDVLYSSDSALDNYLDDLRKRITIKLDEKKGIFFISFVDHDPRFARDFVNTLTQVYIESNTASKRNESLEATKFLADQIDTFKKRIDSVQNEIDAYKAEHGYQLAVDETVLRFEITDAEKKIEAIRARRFELEAQERFLPSGGGGGQGSGVAELERQLANLRSVYTDNHPKVQRMKDQIAALRAHPTPSAPGNTSLSQSRAVIKSELEASKIQEENQLKAIEDKRKLLREIPVIKTGLNDLLRKKDNESQIYSELVTRYGQSEVSKQMEMENKAVSFRIVDAAVLPDAPISPKRLLIMSGSLIGGFGLGLAFVLIPFFMSGSIKNLSDLQTVNLRILAVIPLVPKVQDDRRRKKGDVIFLSGSAAYFSILLIIFVLELLNKPYIENIMARLKSLMM